MSLWRPAEPLVLASGSAARRALLEAAGLPLEVERPDVDERAIEAGVAGGPAEAAPRLAAAKALAVSRRRPGRLVLGADQTLALDGAALHKPRDAEEARSQLARLAGRTHVLHAAAALARDGAVVAAFADEARLTMRPLSAGQIALYVALAGPAALGSVGAYQIEGLGAHLFDRVEGDHTTILGLPLRPTLRALRELGALAL